jgi:four helix bundle protein
MDKKSILKTYKDLIPWQKAYDLCFKIYEMAKNFPKSEEYALTAQIKKSALSIPSNIAEGFNRYHNKEYRQFLFHALGSCAELET